VLKNVGNAQRLKGGFCQAFNIGAIAQSALPRTIRMSGRAAPLRAVFIAWGFAHADFELSAAARTAFRHATSFAGIRAIAPAFARTRNVFVSAAFARASLTSWLVAVGRTEPCVDRSRRTPGEARAAFFTHEPDKRTDTILRALRTPHLNMNCTWNAGCLG
jgi:hypothetical protein